ncbi:MAG: DUF6305 family protein [Armatimonadota bacterium]|nr:DUF6305 family protein [Armatimonadota bacterium]
MRYRRAVLVAVLAVVAGAAHAAPVAQTPALITAPGLAPEGELVRVLCQRIGLFVTYDPLAESRDLAKFRSVMIIIGGSGKGLGAAGIDVQEELKRADALLTEAKRLRLFVIGIHVGGEDRRGPTSAKFIDLVTPRVNYLIVRADGNRDGIFTRLAREHNVPLTIIQQTVELTAVLRQLYGL